MVDVLAGIGMGRFLVRVRVSGVDLGEDALCPVEHRPRACLFWFGQARVAEEHAVDVLGVLGPDRAVLGVVGGLRAAVEAKISRSWRSMRGLKAFCRIRSYIATARAHDVPVFTALRDAFLASPWSIPATA